MLTVPLKKQGLIQLVYNDTAYEMVLLGKQERQ